MLTSSLGWMPSPARFAITSLAFMLEDVPEPVWNTSIGKLIVVLTGRDLIGGGGDPLGLGRVQQPQLGVHPRRGGLDPTQPMHDSRRDRLTRHREVLNRLAGLSAPKLCHLTPP